MNSQDDNIGHEDSRALDYVFGSLSEAEEKEFTQATKNNAVLAEQVQVYSDALGTIAEESALAMPSPRRAMKDKIMAAILNENNSASPEASSILQEPSVIRAGEEGWQESGMPGIMMKVLSRDAATGKLIVLARLEPGAHYPKHRHVGVEDCYVIEGDLNVNDISLLGGDFIRSNDEEVHHDTWTNGGCTLLLSTLLSDVPLD